MTTLCATHSGPFHADDVLAWALLTVFRYPDAELVRTRDPAVLRGADIVFDVGGSFDEANGRFDHHQQSYQGPLCLLYTSPSPRDRTRSRMPSSA